MPAIGLGIVIALCGESGTPITIHDAYFRSAVPMVSVELDAEGTGRGVRRFSGEAIRMAMVDGPWEVRLVATETGAADGQPAMRDVSAPTPAFAADNFGEQVGRLVHAGADVRESLVTVRLIVDVSERFEAHATAFVGDTVESPWSGQNLHERV